MDQLELPAFQAQNASLSYRILLRNGVVGALGLSDPECFIFLKDSIKKWSTWSFEAPRLRTVDFL